MKDLTAGPIAKNIRKRVPIVPPSAASPKAAQ